MFPAFSSIFILTVIALERMYAIGWPFRHRVLKMQTYVVGVAAPWIIAFIVTLSANLLGFVFNKSSRALTTTFLITSIVLTCIA